MEDLQSQVIRLYIKRIRTVLGDVNHRVVFISRPENRSALLELNLTMEDVWRSLRTLTPEEYHKGPENDFDGSPGEVLMFKKIIKKRPVYIKVKLFKDNDGEKLKILSFHL